MLYHRTIGDRNQRERASERVRDSQRESQWKGQKEPKREPDRLLRMLLWEPKQHFLFVCSLGTMWFNELGYEPIVTFSNMLNWTAMALGNHDFDLGSVDLADFSKWVQGS